MRLTPANRQAICQGLWAATMLESAIEKNTLNVAAIQRTRGRRISMAPAMALLGQKRAMPAGTRVNRMEIQEAPNKLAPSNASASGKAELASDRSPAPSATLDDIQRAQKKGSGRPRPQIASTRSCVTVQ